MSRKPPMIEAISPTDHIRRAYDIRSYFYGRMIAPFEYTPRMLALDRADIRPGQKVLEVAVGPGATLLEILKRGAEPDAVYGVDLSPKMLQRARQLVKAAGYANIALREADARQLPFPDDTFDVLYNSYMLDLMPLRDMPLVLNEFKRVLKPGGHLVLVNLSKKNESSYTWWERVYTHLPGPLVPYVFGGCRPVLVEGLVKDAGFCEVRREFVPHVMPSEIVTARRPSL